MSFERIYAVFLKELVQMRRDRPTFAIMIMVPIMQLTLFGFAIDTDPRQLPTVVELRDDGPLTRSLLASMRQSDYFRIVDIVDTDAEGERLLKSGKASFLVVVPENFERDFVRGERPQLLLAADATDPVAASGPVGAMREIAARALQPELDRLPARLSPRGDPVELEKAVARTGIIKGEPIIEAKIVRAGSSGLLAAVLEPGMRAVTMRITPETGVNGFILPGDRVDIYYSETGNVKTETELLFDNVRVLAINTVYTENPEAPTIEGSNATVELSPADAEYFINTRSSRGQMSFALRSVFTPTDTTADRRNQSVRVIRYGRS